MLVYGASGGVGQFVVMIAKAMGCRITAVCSTRNVEKLYEIGADEVIDYQKEEIANCPKCFDAIFGVNGNISLATYKKLLKPGGTYVAIGGPQATSGLVAPMYALGSGKKMTFVMYATAVKKDYLQKLKEFAEEEVLRPYVEKVCTPTELSQVIENICQNHTSGKIVVKLEFDQ